MPNVTKLATSGMPKGRGRKGGKTPTSRRPTVPIQQRIERADDFSPYLPSMAPVYNQSVNTPLSVSITASPTAPGTVVPYSPSTFPGTPPTMPCWGSHPVCYSQTPYGQSLPTSPGIDGTSGGTNPFRVRFLQGSTEKQTLLGNVYYHCNSACVSSIWPGFNPATVIVPSEVQIKLLSEHKHFLLASLGVFVM